MATTQSKTNRSPAISVSQLTVRYPNENESVVRNVSFSLDRGKIGVLLGPNGSGKSTVMKAMLGLVEFVGEVQFAGQPLTSLQNHVGYVPQRYPIDKSVPMTVSEFLELALVTCSHTKAEKNRMIVSVLEQVDLSLKRFEKVGDLSGGQVQRLLLARALVHEPEVLLLDEPEAGVDAEGELIMYDLLQKLAKDQKVTVLLASHEIGLVRKFADTVFCVKNTLVCSGAPSQVLNQSTFKQLYGDGMTMYGHDHHHDHHHGNHE
ncbi:MAG: metal ABC transporter ATP-binding protein [Pseudomonadales bacterium]|nr:metal ABC transporter ATP-binding protein [Pseudomonadales bacterium]